MATLKRYKDGNDFYAVMDFSYRTQTLQVSTSGNKLLRDMDYGDESFLPHTLVKALVLAGDLHTKRGGPDRDDILSHIPTLTPEKCELSQEKQSQLRSHLQRRAGALSRDTFDDLNEFLEDETPISPVDWKEDPEATEKVKDLQNIADDIF